MIAVPSSDIDDPLGQPAESDRSHGHAGRAIDDVQLGAADDVIVAEDHVQKSPVGRDGQIGPRHFRALLLNSRVQGQDADPAREADRIQVRAVGRYGVR